MILYIVSYKNAEIVESCINDCQKAIFEKFIEERFDLALFMKQKIDKLDLVDTLIIDESALDNADEEIIKALSSFRLLYEDKKIIFISLTRSSGDKLLSDIFSLGIYNIIAGEMDPDELKRELLYCLNYGKTFRDGIIYKDNYKEIEEETGTKIKERIIVKNEIRTAVNKALIGFAGTQRRIGVTHMVIAAANYLKNKGFKIAALEYIGAESKAFTAIQETYQVKKEEEYFRLKGIDFYPEFNLNNIPRVLNKNYNLVLIDFGIYKKEIQTEFNRCVMPIIICGSKPWEVESINKIFEAATEEELKEYYYLFNFTDSEDHNLIKQGMGELKKVYFSNIIINPFTFISDESMDLLFKEYIPETEITTQKEKLFDIKELIKKIKWERIGLK